MKIIELSLLKGACERQMDKVRKEWPEGIPVTQASLDRALELGLDLDWAAERLLSKTALAEYSRYVLALTERDCLSDLARAVALFRRRRGRALLRCLLSGCD